MRVEFPASDLISAADAAALALRQERRHMLEVMGVQLLQFAQLDYVTKARGGTGTDGVKWEPILVSTVLARLRRKAGHLKSKPVAGSTASKKPKSVLVVAKTVKGNQALFSQLAAAGVKFHDKKTGKVIIGDRARYKAGTTLSNTRAAGKSRLKQAPGSYEIGVDTGLQRASSGPGFTAPDGKGGNIQQMDDTSITVGYGRSYSNAFDKHRKLFPDVMPVKWVEELQDIATTLGGKVIDDSFKESGVS